MNTETVSAIDQMVLTFLSAPAAQRTRVLEILVEEFVAEARRKNLPDEKANNIARRLAEHLTARVLEITASGGDVGIAAGAPN